MLLLQRVAERARACAAPRLQGLGPPPPAPPAAMKPRCLLPPALTRGLCPPTILPHAGVDKPALEPSSTHSTGLGAPPGHRSPTLHHKAAQRKPRWPQGPGTKTTTGTPGPLLPGTSHHLPRGSGHSPDRVSRVTDKPTPAGGFRAAPTCTWSLTATHRPLHKPVRPAAQRGLSEALGGAHCGCGSVRGWLAQSPGKTLILGTMCTPGPSEHHAHVDQPPPPPAGCAPHHSTAPGDIPGSSPARRTREQPRSSSNTCFTALALAATVRLVSCCAVCLRRAEGQVRQGPPSQIHSFRILCDPEGCGETSPSPACS